MLQRLVLALVVVLFPLALRAEEPVFATQKKLAQLGFYKGVPDGRMGSQTSAAIRRYQVAENLKVTGELNQQTLQQLGIPGAAPTPSYMAISEIFKGGPYRSAGPEKQVAVVRQAQKNLKLLGYFHGPEDGVPGGGLIMALKVWQRSAGFHQTGRFDVNTLKGLDLMPD